MAGAKWSIGRPSLGRFGKRPFFAIALPLRAASGAVAAVLVGPTFPSDDNLFGELEQAKIGKTGYYVVWSPKHHLIVSATDKSRILQTLPAKGENALLDRRIEGGYEGPGITRNSHGTEMLTVARYIRSTGWLVVAAIPTREAFAPIETLKRQIYLAALLISVAVMALLRFVLARQLAPLEDAARAMRRMSTGEEAFAPIPVARQDEIGQLVANFNELVAGRKATEQQIEFLAYHDALTGLPNRLLVRDRLRQATAYADRTRSRVALIFLDLDNFKTINDSLGHFVGDTLLKTAANRLRECVRDTDTISRQGGDEFLILIPDLPDADAVAPEIDKLMGRLQEPFAADGHELSTTGSIGVAIYPDDGGDFDTLLKKADMAMYRAKDAGRNAYRFFDEQMNVEALEQLAIRNGLRRALEHGEFVLHYQPQIDLGSGRVVGAEALIRWNNPERGMIPPGRFIAIAEDNGLIVPIGEWVMNEACRQAAAWKNSGFSDVAVAVNLSAVQFKRSDVERTVTRALEASGLDPSLLELELTESLLIRDTESVLATVTRLKRLGVRLSIDDFGTGYSSLSYLTRFSVDKLKIDQSFICDLASDPEDAAIVRAIIQMARSLGLRTLAEGVEAEGMLEHLRLFRCDEAQGYHFARPMPAAEFSDYLRSSRL